MANIRIILKSGLEVNRTNHLPKLGEVIYTEDTKQTFVGDGKTMGGLPIVSNSTVVESMKELVELDSKYLIVYVENTSTWFSRTVNRPTFKPMKTPPLSMGDVGIDKLYLK